MAANSAGAAETGPPQPSRTEQQILYEVGQAIEKEAYRKAEKQLTKRIKKHEGKTDYRLFFQLGNIYSLQGHAQKALSAYKKAVSRCNRDPALWQNMGKACHDLGRFSCAGKHMERAYRLQEKKKPDLLYQAAGCRLMAKETESAYQLLKELCAKDDAEVRPEWLNSLAHACMELEKNPEAEQAIRCLLHRQPDAPRWWKMMANFHIKSEAYNKAAAALKIHNQLVPPKKEDVIRLGDLYMAAGAPLKAAEQYEAALQWTQSSEHFKRIASAYLAAHRPEKAAAILERAVGQAPSARLWRMLGTIRYNQDKPDLAYRAFKKSHRIDPMGGRAVLMMGYSALKSGNKQEAIAAFKNASAFKSQRNTAIRGLEVIRASNSHQEKN
ncbi:MAG: tetratricopeptide repeat protein [Desulfobacterales bacterium]